MDINEQLRRHYATATPEMAPGLFRDGQRISFEEFQATIAPHLATDPQGQQQQANVLQQIAQAPPADPSATGAYYPPEQPIDPATAAAPQPAQDPTNVLQAVAPPPTPPTPPVEPAAATVPEEHPRKRQSAIDIIGRLADVFANVGGAQPQYQPTLDAREDRALGLEDRQRKIELEGLQRKIIQQQIGAGATEIEDTERVRIGRVLDAFAKNPNAIGQLPEAFAQAGVAPDRAAQIIGVLQKNPTIAGPLAKAMGYEAQRQGSLSGAVQNYEQYKQILATEGEEAAQRFLSMAQPSSQINPYQKEMLELLQEDRNLRRQEIEDRREDRRNPPLTATERREAEKRRVQLQSTIRGFDETTKKGGILDRLSNAFKEAKEAGVIYSSGRGIGSRVATFAQRNVPFLQQTLNEKGTRAQEQINTILNQMTLDTLPLMTATQLGGRNFDAAKELEFHRQRIASVTDYDAAMRELAALRQRINTRLQEAKTDLHVESETPAPSRSTSAGAPQDARAAALLEARRRGLIQ